MAGAHSSVSSALGLTMTAVGGFVDAYTYLQHGVFATAQTGNVVLFGVALARGDPAWLYVWPILGFVAGVALATVVGMAEPAREHRLIAAVLGVQAAVLAALAVIPASAPTVLVTVPVAALAGVQLSLFRTLAGIPFVSIATTGNLMRATQFTLAAVRTRSRADRRTAAAGSAVVACFAVGATVGAVLTSRWAEAIVVAAAAQAGVALVFARQRHDHG